MSTPITKRYIKRYQGYAKASPEYQTYMDLIERLDEFVRDHRYMIQKEFPVVEEIRLILTRMSLKKMQNHEYRVISESFGRESNPYIREIVRVFGECDTQNGKATLTRIFNAMVKYSKTESEWDREWLLGREIKYQKGLIRREDIYKRDMKEIAIGVGIFAVGAALGEFLGLND